jgi:peroxiredoxin
MRFIPIALLTCILITACREEESLKPYITGMEGKVLPAFNIQLPDSSSFINTDNISKGKEIVVFCYSPTCPYCRAQMRDMVNNIERFQDRQLWIITNADLRSMRKFVDYFKLEDYKNMLVGRDTGSVLARTYGLERVPFTGYFNKNKELKVAYSGRMTSDKIFQFH